MKFKLLISMAGVLFFVGCKSQQIQTLPTYPWETVYTAENQITVNGQLIKIDKKERVWILTDRTLGYIIYDAKHHYYK